MYNKNIRNDEDMTMNKYKQLSKIMGDATKEVALANISLTNIKPVEVEFTTRIGMGRRTYHQRKSTGVHSITYGVKFINENFDQNIVDQWMSSTEIKNYGFFNGKITTLNILAHVVCHESAHLIQTISGNRHYGSVHNRSFYQILRRMHDSGLANKVREYIETACEKHDIELSFEKEKDLTANLPKRAFISGNPVHFEYKGKRVSGKVIKNNQKTISVVLDEKQHISGIARVPYEMIEHRVCG